MSGWLGPGQEQPLSILVLLQPWSRAELHGAMAWHYTGTGLASAVTHHGAAGIQEKIVTLSYTIITIVNHCQDQDQCWWPWATGALISEGPCPLVTPCHYCHHHVEMHCSSAVAVWECNHHNYVWSPNVYHVQISQSQGDWDVRNDARDKQSNLMIMLQYMIRINMVT